MGPTLGSAAKVGEGVVERGVALSECVDRTRPAPSRDNAAQPVRPGGIQVLAIAGAY
jgi:hypothetical protein